MGQEVRGVPEAAALNGAAPGSEESAVGPYLAQQRELRGISLDDLSSRTKIPRRSLERLESGAFDHSADGFSRGFVRTVADALGLDPDDAVMRLLGEPLEAEDEAAEQRSGTRQWLAIGAVLLLAIGLLSLGVWGLRGLLSSDAETAPSSELLYRRDAVRALADSVGDEGEPTP